MLNSCFITILERLHALGANVKVSRPKSARKPSKTKKDTLPKIEIPESSVSFLNTFSCLKLTPEITLLMI